MPPTSRTPSRVPTRDDQQVTGTEPLISTLAIRQRREPPRVPAHLEYTATRYGTVEVNLFISCPWCGGRHRHHSDGLRVAGCGRGLYRVVAA